MFPSSLFNLCFCKKTQGQAYEDAILALYHAIAYLTSYLKSQNSSKTAFCYSNAMRHSYWEWLHSIRQVSSDMTDHLPTRTSIQLSQAGRDRQYQREKDTRFQPWEKPKPGAEGKIEAVAAPWKQACTQSWNQRTWHNYKSLTSPYCECVLT